jgi:predicted extracellular nuclease
MMTRMRWFSVVSAAAALLAVGCGDRDGDPVVRPDGGTDIAGDTPGDATTDGQPDTPLPDTTPDPDATADTPDLVQDVEFDVPPGMLTIYDLQDPTSPNRPALESRVTVRGIVTAIDRRQFGDNPTTFGSFYIQDPTGGAYSGIFVYNIGGNDPDITNLQVGQTVDVTGTYTEFFDLTQIVAEDLDVVNATPQPLLPQTVDPAAVATGGPQAEAYEGVLVQVLDVTVTANDIGFGKFVVTGGLEIDDELTAFPAFPPVGHTYDRLAGVLTYTFNAVQLNPRDANDIEGDVQIPVLRIQDIQDETSPQYPALGSTVTVTGVVTAIDTFQNGASINTRDNFWIQDPAGGEFSGIFVFTMGGSRYTPEGNLQEGYTVSVTGTTAEFRTQTQIVLAQDAVEILDTTSVLPEPVLVNPVSVATGGPLREAYEGVFVRVEDVTVTAHHPIFQGSYEVAGALIVSNTFMFITRPEVGVEIESIQGIMTSFDDNASLNPRSEDDIVLAPVD